MSEDKGLTTRIDRKLSGLSNSFSKQRIFRVDHNLRSQNEVAYEPQMFSIGPYHHGKENLVKAQTYKLWYLKELLLRRGESSTERYINALKDIEDEARSWYAEEDMIGLGSEEFVEMMLLDGFFIIEFLRKYAGWCLYKDYPLNYGPKQGDPIFLNRRTMGSLFRDILLFENQLPFFILVRLFEMTKSPGGDEEENLVDLAIFPDSPLHLFFPGEKPNGDLQDNCSTSGEVNEHIKCASELRQAGIKFETANKSVSWLDIAFEKGVMKIPTLDVQDVTECVFRNLIGFELYMINGLYDRRYIIDYVTFMDSLIASSRDVEKLRRQKIITKWLGDDEAISSVFNGLVKEVETYTGDNVFCYWRVFKQVNEYSSRRRNIWRAHLMRNYFNNPWSIISFAAALVLLSLTFVQTIFSILQFENE
ncbi:unnamed protein product [Coffea canephora]|uniref:DH200=94 genomic scaffold, scaffold_3018 n=1 Tax=Coffea canephora TaxID=49390 RepID=A0A068VL11_COFCA|nr:unnamed protein product [Coffea canephora]